MNQPDWPEVAALMSNCDNEVDEKVAEQLKTEQVVARYPGWNFNAMCWFSDGLFHAAVWQYHVHVATMSAETPEQLMEAISSKYGWG